MRHKWTYYDHIMGTHYQVCAVCGAWRSRDNDYSGSGWVMMADGSRMHISARPLSTGRGWKNEADTPRSCPGTPIDLDAVEQEPQ